MKLEILKVKFYNNKYYLVDALNYPKEGDNVLDHKGVHAYDKFNRLTGQYKVIYKEFPMWEGDIVPIEAIVCGDSFEWIYDTISHGEYAKKLDKLKWLMLENNTTVQKALAANDKGKPTKIVSIKEEGDCYTLVDVNGVKYRSVYGTNCSQENQLFLLAEKYGDRERFTFVWSQMKIYNYY